MIKSSKNVIDLKFFPPHFGKAIARSTRISQIQQLDMNEYSCQVCPSRFSRPEHLKRHAVSRMFRLSGKIPIANLRQITMPARMSVYHAETRLIGGERCEIDLLETYELMTELATRCAGMSALANLANILLIHTSIIPRVVILTKRIWSNGDATQLKTRKLLH
jgi:hypothetical protein